MRVGLKYSSFLKKNAFYRMKTQIVFGSPKEECRTELFLLSKGSWSSVKEGIESKLNGKVKNQVGGDLFTKPNAPSNITMWHELNENQYQQVILAQYENKLSRNMGYIRSDVIQKEIAKHIPSSGDASVTVCVKDSKVSLLSLSKNLIYPFQFYSAIFSNMLYY